MAIINDTGKVTTKWMRYIAVGLALIWAVCWTFFGLVSGAGEGLKGVLTNIPNTLPGLVFLVSTAIAWRWEAIGGVALLMCGLFALFFFHIGKNPFLLLTMVLPPLVAGFLFLVSWWKSRNINLELQMRE